MEYIPHLKQYKALAILLLYGMFWCFNWVDSSSYQIATPSQHWCVLAYLIYFLNVRCKHRSSSPKCYFMSFHYKLISPKKWKNLGKQVTSSYLLKQLRFSFLKHLSSDHLTEKEYMMQCILQIWEQQFERANRKALREG